MTKNSFDKFRDVGSPLTEWTIPAEDGVHRRTIVKGAAWTIPVVAVAVATPAAAASKTPTLAFTKGSYTGTACKTITGVQVKRTTDGTTADAGQTITVTLKDGYKFKDGTTTYSATSGADGTITLPDITVPAPGGDSTFNATSGTLSASAPVTATSNIANSQQYGTKTAATTYAAPSGDGLTSVGFATFLNSNGDLYHNETKTDTKVTSAVAEHINDNGSSTDLVTYVADGVAKSQAYGSSTTATTYSTPTGDGLKAVGYATFLNSAGDLWHENTLVATGVTSAVAEHNYDSGGAYDTVTYVTGGVGKSQQYGAKTALTTYKAPTGDGLKAVGFATFLNTAGDLYHAETKTATGVTSAVAEHTTDNGTNTDLVTFVSGGVAKSQAYGSSTTATTYSDAKGDGIKAIGYGAFLNTAGELFHGNTKTATEVTSAVGEHNYDAGSYDTVTYVKKPTCP